MIVSFSISNFRSFLGEQTLTLVASKRLSGTHDDHTVEIPDSDERVLRAAVIYGANGAGKSNLLKALMYVRGVALRPRKKARGTRREVFRFDDLGAQPSTFDIRFIAKGSLFRFVFSIDDDHVIEESLILESGNREKTLYERTTDEQGKVQVVAPGLKDTNPKLSALITVGGPANQSFLATVRATLESQDFGEELSAVLHWMTHGLTLVAPDASFKDLSEKLSTDDEFRNFAGAFLKEASTGVDHLDVDRKVLTQDELRALIPKEFESVVAKNIAEGATSSVRVGRNAELIIEKEGIFQVTINGAHKHKSKGTVPLELLEESDGTQRLLELLPALYELKTDNAVYFIDEIDRSMHPMLVNKFMEFFLKLCRDKACQIIVTTHETNLLNLDLLRRDEIWFVDKNEDGASQLYSLTDYNVRKDLQVRKGYLEGRFGAVPFLSGLDRLLQSRDVSECP